MVTTIINSNTLKPSCFDFTRPSLLQDADSMPLTMHSSVHREAISRSLDPGSLGLGATLQHRRLTLGGYVSLPYRQPSAQSVAAPEGRNSTTNLGRSKEG